MRFFSSSFAIVKMRSNNPSIVKQYNNTMNTKNRDNKNSNCNHHIDIRDCFTLNITESLLLCRDLAAVFESNEVICCWD